MTVFRYELVRLEPSDLKISQQAEMVQRAKVIFYHELLSSLLRVEIIT